MPLHPAPGAPRPDHNHIRFCMQDADSGEVVICRITEEALRKLSGSPVHCMQTMFIGHRRLAERLASAKFDAGEDYPLVTEGDVEVHWALLLPNSDRTANLKLGGQAQLNRYPPEAEQPSAPAIQPPVSGGTETAPASAATRG